MRPTLAGDSDRGLAGVHAQVEGFFRGWMKPEAISIACAGGFTSGVPHDPTLEWYAGVDRRRVS